MRSFPIFNKEVEFGEVLFIKFVAKYFGWDNKHIIKSTVAIET